VSLYFHAVRFQGRHAAAPYSAKVEGLDALAVQPHLLLNDVSASAVSEVAMIQQPFHLSQLPELVLQNDTNPKDRTYSHQNLIAVRQPLDFRVPFQSRSHVVGIYRGYDNLSDGCSVHLIDQTIFPSCGNTRFVRLHVLLTSLLLSSRCVGIHYNVQIVRLLGSMWLRHTEERARANIPGG
jgi:hypothetical protein